MRHTRTANPHFPYAATYFGRGIRMLLINCRNILYFFFFCLGGIRQTHFCQWWLYSFPLPLSLFSQLILSHSALRFTLFCHISRSLHGSKFILQTRSQSQTEKEMETESERTPAIVNIIKIIEKRVRQQKVFASVCATACLSVCLSVTSKRCCCCCCCCPSFWPSCRAEFMRNLCLTLVFYCCRLYWIDILIS